MLLLKECAACNALRSRIGRKKQQEFRRMSSSGTHAMGPGSRSPTDDQVRCGHQPPTERHIRSKFWHRSNSLQLHSSTCKSMMADLAMLQSTSTYNMAHHSNLYSTQVQWWRAQHCRLGGGQFVPPPYSTLHCALHNGRAPP